MEGRIAARHAAGSPLATKVVSMPKRVSHLANRLTVEPKMLPEETMWSPLLSMPMHIDRIAAMPLAVATHISAPSIAARRSSKAVTVGLVKRE